MGKTTEGHEDIDVFVVTECDCSLCSGHLRQAETCERESQENNDDGDDINLPLKSRKLPSFIALESSGRGPLRKTKKDPLDESLGNSLYKVVVRETETMSTWWRKKQHSESETSCG